MNLRKQVEPLSKPRFRLPRTEACTPRGVATHFDETLAQTSLPPSRAKQGTQTSQRSYDEMGAAFKDGGHDVRGSGFRVPGSGCLSGDRCILRKSEQCGAATRNQNLEPGTRNLEPGTWNQEP